MNEPTKPTTIRPGSPEHASLVTFRRQQATQDALQWLAYTHLPEHLQRFSRPLFEAALALIRTITTDGPELTTSLNTLVQAKDHAMRAGIRSTTGRAGSVPRPQETVDPPKLADTTSHFDENTMVKVRQVLKRGTGYTDEVITHLISDMQNEGILFRERQ